MDCPKCGKSGLFTQHPVIDHFFANGRSVTAERPKSVSYGDLGFAGMQSCFFVDPDIICVWRCPSCGSFLVEAHREIVWPEAAPIPAHEDMPDTVREVYDEAQAVYPKSPRAACAMLRATAERLVDHLSPSSEGTLSQRIRSLTVSPTCLLIFEAARMTGNEAVHGSEVDFSESNGEAIARFQLLSDGINRVIDELITQPRKLQSLKEEMIAAKARAREKAKAQSSEPKA